MSLNRYAKRRDDNEQEVVDALEAIGCSVCRLDRPVDLLVGYRAKNYIIEVKGEAGRLTPSQKEFFKSWRGQVRIVHSAEEAIEVVTQSYKVT